MIDVAACDQPTVSPSRGSLRGEIATISGAVAVYFGVRIVVEGSSTAAFRNADRLLDFERAVGIDVERAAQDVVLDHDALRALGNFSYVWLHWPLLVVVLIVLWGRDRSIYGRLRNSLIASGAVGLVLFTLFPMAPPRFVDGYTGTVSAAARSHYLNIPVGWTNQYAAFPSFHVGWTLIACIGLAMTFDQRHVRALVLTPAVLVSLSVVTTGNHYVIDAIVGAAIALAAFALFGRLQPARPARPTRESDAERPARLGEAERVDQIRKIGSSE